MIDVVKDKNIGNFMANFLKIIGKNTPKHFIYFVDTFMICNNKSILYLFIPKSENL